MVPLPALPSFSSNVPRLELSAAEVRLALSEVGIPGEAMVSSRSRPHLYGSSSDYIEFSVLNRKLKTE